MRQPINILLLNYNRPKRPNLNSSLLPIVIKRGMRRAMAYPKIPKSLFNQTTSAPITLKRHASFLVVKMKTVTPDNKDLQSDVGSSIKHYQVMQNLCTNPGCKELICSVPKTATGLVPYTCDKYTGSIGMGHGTSNPPLNRYVIFVDGINGKGQHINQYFVVKINEVFITEMIIRKEIANGHIIIVPVGTAYIQKYIKDIKQEIYDHYNYRYD